MSREPTDRQWLESLRERAGVEPIGLDISDYSDDWCQGFLAGQVNAIDIVLRDKAGQAHNAEIAEGEYEANQEQYR